MARRPASRARLPTLFRLPQVPGPGLDEGPQARETERHAEAGMPPARPGQAGAHAVAAVPVGGTGRGAGEQPARAWLVAGIDAGGQAVLGVVHETQGLLVVLHLLDADEGTEGLVAHQRHRGAGVREHRGREVEAGTVEALTAEPQARAPGLRVRDLLLEHAQVGFAR